MNKPGIQPQEILVVIGSVCWAVVFGYLAYKGPDIIPQYIEHPTDEGSYLDRAYDELDVDVNAKFIYFFCNLVKKRKSGPEIAEYLLNVLRKHEEYARIQLGDRWSYDPEERFKIAKRRLENAKTEEEKFEESLRVLKSAVSASTFYLHGVVLKLANDPSGVAGSEVDRKQAEFEKKLKDMEVGVNEMTWSNITPGLNRECFGDNPTGEDIVDVYNKVIHKHLRKCLAKAAMTYLTDEQYENRQTLFGMLVGIASFVSSLIYFGRFLPKNDAYLIGPARTINTS
uniref:Uncharacterized protein n=1 Tax=Steinernema glaseri TaxID=37863 RepID=A0A1I7YWC6_9BILA